MPKAKLSPLTESLRTLLTDYSMPEVVAELILICRRCAGGIEGGGWLYWESTLTTALTEVESADEVEDLIGKPARKASESKPKTKRTKR
jgi:hypothetical protein